MTYSGHYELVHFQFNSILNQAVGVDILHPAKNEVTLHLDNEYVCNVLLYIGLLNISFIAYKMILFLDKNKTFGFHRFFSFLCFCTLFTFELIKPGSY